MIGTIGLIASVLGTAASGIMSGIGNAKAQSALNAENARQNAFYENQLYKDPLTQYHNQNMIGQLQRRLRERLATAQARKKITGELDTTNVMRDQNAKAMSDVYGNILSNESLRLSGIESAYNNARHNQFQAQQAIDQARMQNYANLAQNAGALGAAALGGLDAKEKKPTPTTTPTTTTAGMIEKPLPKWATWKQLYKI